MSSRAPLNLFYEEPDSDRWVPLDRYPRRMARWALRGPGQPGGAMRVYLSHHETQGLAARQRLASDVLLLAWDHGGLWKDPKYAPHLGRFGLVTSVPYWDERCGLKFKGVGDLLPTFEKFWRGVEAGLYAPREMIVEKFTLEDQATAYLVLAGKYGSG